MSEDEWSAEREWDKFLQAWPVERIKNLTLQEYTTSADDRSGDDPDYPFTFWLESITEDLGSIWGGSAFKFGIFKRQDKSKKKSKSGLSYNKDYGWYSKFGSSPEEAFENVKQELLGIISNVQNQNLVAIDNSKLGDVLSWKVAFLYQNRKNPIVAPIYSAKALKQTNASFGKKTPLSHCHEILMSERRDKDIFDYAEELLGQEKAADSVMNEAVKEYSPINKSTGNYPLNQILYGPPGTGKTWTSSEIAVKICDGQASNDRNELMGRYRELVKSGRIAFTTFHQSMGYEEFVEGLRPVTDGDADEGTAGSGFRLVARNGLFRNICALAKESGTHNSKIDINLDKHAIFKMSLGNAKTEPHIYAASLKKNCITLGYGGQFDWSDPKFNKYDIVKNQWDTLGQNGQDMTSGIREFRKFRCDMSIGDIVIVSDGNSAFRAIGQVIGNYEFAEPSEDGEDPFDEGNYYHHRRKVKWLKILEESLPVENIKSGKFTQSSCYRLDKSQINFDVLERLISAGETGNSNLANNEVQNYVLIIDEINRANISKVFGELITLLEPDKRIGSGPNALQVTLPYSRDKFGVPQNLYIVGTMNTADRSIALLDTALRRRFSFKEMMPRYDIAPINRKVEGIHLGKLLKAINARIEWMFDRDHQIGHSFLTSVQTLDELDQVMRNKIIPLLAEYFYEDWEKVCVALNDKGNRFIKKKKLIAPSMEGSEDEERFRYKVKVKSFPLEAYKTVYQS